jgi:predicted nuclease of predicted toxin-antitoxin system
MRLLLDECIPRKLKDALAGHACQTVPEAGLAGKNNGELLSFAEKAGFDVFVTLDPGIKYSAKFSIEKTRDTIGSY